MEVVALRGVHLGVSFGDRRYGGVVWQLETTATRMWPPRGQRVPDEEKAEVLPHSPLAQGSSCGLRPALVLPVHTVSGTVWLCAYGYVGAHRGPPKGKAGNTNLKPLSDKLVKVCFMFYGQECWRLRGSAR